MASISKESSKFTLTKSAPNNKGILGRGLGTHNQRPRNNSRPSYSRHCSAYDQSYRRRCRGAYNGTDFKNEKRAEKNPFDVEFSVELAKEKLEAAIR